MEAAESRPWSDLPPELLVLVLKRLPSLADRVRLRAVCHPWHSNSTLQPLPLPFPWLTLPDGTLLSIPGGEIHHIPVPGGARCQGSIDDWLFLMDKDNVCSLVNPFSKTMLELPNLFTVCQQHDMNYTYGPQLVFIKLVVPSPLDPSSDSLAAAVIMDYGRYSTLFDGAVRIKGDSPLFRDAAFLDGKLYVFNWSYELCVVESDNNLGISSIECIIRRPEHFSTQQEYKIKDYLVECGGRLLIVRRWIQTIIKDSIESFQDDITFTRSVTASFEVFEADLRASPGEWRRASELGGHAIFLGQHNSKSFPAEECSGCHEDCIYFMCDYLDLLSPTASGNPLCDSGVYNIKNDTIMPLMSGAAAAQRVGLWRPTWLFPPEAV